MKLLTVSNHKLSKSTKFGYLTGGLTLAPNTKSGYNVCSHATPGCISACNLWFAGRTVTMPVRSAMIRRTKMFFENRKEFDKLLYKEIGLLRNKAKKIGLRLAVRLNTASDLPWERLAPDLFTAFSDVSFYDYTKVRSRVKDYIAGKLPDNYELTYSWNERSNTRQAQYFLDNGVNIAFVTELNYVRRTGYMEPAPKLWRLGSFSYPAIDGDKHDLRLKDLDGIGSAILLRFKGSQKSKLKAKMDRFIK